MTSYRRELSAALAILLLGVVLAIAAPQFFTVENQTDLALANLPVMIVALGMTLIILTGQIDISVGSAFAICSVAAGVFAKMGLPVALAGLAACLTGAALGALNGALVAYVRVPSIVVTLAAMVALRDSLRWSTDGEWIQNLPADFQWFGLSQAASQSIAFAIVIALLLAAAWVLANVAAGRAVYATGSNEEAARLSGINSSRVTFAAFVITGALTGCAALLNSIRFNQIPSNAGVGMEMKVIAAVVVGGAAINGGRGTILGTILGVILLGAIGPALTFLGVNAYWEKAIQGAIILTAVAIDAARVRAERHAT